MTVHSTISTGSPWYALFSRGARDWLRHNEKIRESVQQKLPDLVAGGDLITGPQERTVHVPVKVLEHARFRLSDNAIDSERHAGQGHGQPGDILRPAQPRQDDDDGDEAEGGNDDGGVRLLLELGAKLEAVDKHGRMVLHCTAARGHAGVVELLLERGAKLEAADKHGRTVLDLADVNGHTGVVELLRPREGASDLRGSGLARKTAKAEARGCGGARGSLHLLLGMNR